MVEQGVFLDPSEAVFVYMQQAKEIEPHDDLKQEILSRRLEKSLDDAKNGRIFTSEEVKRHLEETAENRSEPVVWKKRTARPVISRC